MTTLLKAKDDVIKVRELKIRELENIIELKDIKIDSLKQQLVDKIVLEQLLMRADDTYEVVNPQGSFRLVRNKVNYIGPIGVVSVKQIPDAKPTGNFKPHDRFLKR